VRELRAVADEVGATLLFDGAHLAGLIAGHAWPNPLAEGAHLLTMSTYKSLGGPPSGLVLTNDADIAARLDAIAFPGLTANFDAAKAAKYYARIGSPAVAAKFVAEFRRVAERLVEYPSIGSRRSRGRRDISMSIFPYTVIYRTSGDTMLVLVVKHDSRRPNYGGSRK